MRIEAVVNILFDLRRIYVYFSLNFSVLVPLIPRKLEVEKKMICFNTVYIALWFTLRRRGTFPFTFDTAC